MQVVGCRQPEPPLQQHLGRGEFQQVDTTHHLGDALGGVVHYHGELVGEQAVGASQHKIADLPREVELEPAVVAVFDGQRDARRAQPDRAVAVGCGRVRQAGSRVDGATEAGARDARDRAAAAIAPVAVAVSREPFECVEVGVRAGRLVEDRAVPGQSVPLETGEDGIGRAGHLAGRVKILDAHQPLPGLVARLQVAGYRGHQRAEVERPGRRRGEPSAVDGYGVAWRRWVDGGQGRDGAAVRPGVQVRIWRSRISSSSLHSMHSVAVGRASSRRMPISTPQESQ